MLHGQTPIVMAARGPADPPFALDEAAHDRDVDRVAFALASEDAVTAEARVEALATIAVHRRQLDDVVFWQRVMFKARLIRARRGVPPPPIGQVRGERTC